MPEPPAIRRLLPSQILEIERLAMVGLGIPTIAASLGYDEREFFNMVAADPDIDEAIRIGRHRGIMKVATSLFRSAISERDSGAARFFLERICRDQWLPPRMPAPVVIVERASANIDCDAIARRLERQRALVDGTSKELDDPGPAPTPAEAIVHTEKDDTDHRVA